MENDNENEMDMFEIQFPIAKKVSAKLLAIDIVGMTPEETREAMKKMFDNFEKQTGYKPTIVGDSLPIKALFPKENSKNSKNEK